jgi:hypothetical protein
MEKTIVDNAHLIEGLVMPTPFQELLAHVEVYRVVMKKWEGQDYSEHTSYLNFPFDLNHYVEDTFTRLKEEQARIIAAIF